MSILALFGTSTPLSTASLRLGRGQHVLLWPPRRHCAMQHIVAMRVGNGVGGYGRNSVMHRARGFSIVAVSNQTIAMLNLVPCRKKYRIYVSVSDYKIGFGLMLPELTARQPALFFHSKLVYCCIKRWGAARGYFYLAVVSAGASYESYL